MKISVIHPTELGEAERAAWREMQEGAATLRNPFLSANFTTAVAQVRPCARVAVLENSRRVVGFLPFERRALGVGTAIGMGYSDCQGLIHEQGFDWDAREIVQKSHLAVWEFDHLLADQSPFATFHDVRTRSPIMDLTAGYEAYAAGRRSERKNVVQSTWRKSRKLEREVGTIDFVYDSRDFGLLRKVMGWKSDQWRRTAQPDKFANPAMVELIYRLFESRDAGCCGSLSVLTVDGEPVAGHFGMRSSSVLTSWFPSYDTAFESYSPGLLMFFKMAEAAAADEIGHIDLGKGEMRYKDSLANGEIALAEGSVVHSPAVGALRRIRHAPDRQFRPWLRRHTRAHATVRRIRDTVGAALHR
jgi:CelD/BcsL family acetyltransferase involved in cellulose biosynthesis